MDADQADLADVDARLDELVRGVVVRNRRVPHLVLGVARLDGSWSWSGAAGTADPGGRPMTTTTPYFVASVTKLYTAAATLILHERGLLSLADPIAVHLPSDLVDGLHVRRGVDRSREITVRHLLAHTSGLPDYFEGRPRGGRSLARRLLGGQDASWDAVTAIRVVRETMTPPFPPQPPDGRRALYSDTNYQLLGLLLEAVTGQAFADVVADLLLRPLGLTESHLFGHVPAPGQVPASGHVPAPERPATIWAGTRPLAIDGAMRSFWADGALVSTVADQLAFMRALAGGQVFAEPATTDLMQERWHRLRFPLAYGLGTMRVELPRWATPFGAVPVLVGHSGASGSWLFHCPALDVVLAGTVDQARAPSLPFRLLPRVLRIVSTA